MLKNDPKLHFEQPGHFRILFKNCIFGNLSMTQIMDANRFWGLKKISKFLDLLSWFDSFRTFHT